MSIKRQTKSINKKVGSSEFPIHVSGIYLEINKRTGSGFYSVSDPGMAEAIVDTLVRIAKGQILRIDNDNGNDNPLQLQQHINIQEGEHERARNQSEELDKVLLLEPEKTDAAK